MTQHATQSPVVRPGLEVLLTERASILQGRRVGAVVHPASIDRRLRHASTLLHQHPDIRLTTLYGPQHGLWGEMQDNMIEWEGFLHPQLRIPVHSLYGQHRKPTLEMLREVDVMLFDIQDVGAKYYTFISTLSYVMEACGEAGIPVVVLDRPNPITGGQVEGYMTQPPFRSFVGVHALAIRHGMTIGELAQMFRGEFHIFCDLQVVPCQGWRRDMWFDETGLPWVLPSPNIPTQETALVYPGTCLLEGTNLSEGRGTTRPFEIMGAPFINPFLLVAELARAELPGVCFRPLYFRPTFQKWSGQVCGGTQLHILDRDSFRPVLTAAVILSCVKRLYPREFAWHQPPYEYEHEKLPIDILAGSPTFRALIDAETTVKELEESWREDVERFRRLRAPHLLYPGTAE